MIFEPAQAVADAVLYEGYVLYPYRASAAKNRVRWQFGVVAPRGYGDGSEPWAMQTECLVEPADATALHLRVRFLQAQARTVEEAVDAGRDAFRPVETLEVEGARVATWDEGVERHVDGPAMPLASVLAAERTLPFDVPGGRDVELLRGADGAVAGRIVRERWPISGVVRVRAEAAGRLVRLRVRVENVSAWPPAGGTEPDAPARDLALRRSLLGAHTLLALDDGAFISSLDPPPWAAAAAASCANLHTWPVLVGREGERGLMLSSPIILYDYPAVAPESPGDLFDATEIDEILTLRIMTLTDEEKREARGTDERARRIVERSDTIPPELFGRLHGAIRSLGTPRDDESAERARWSFSLDPQADADPHTAWVDVGGTRVSRGSRVRLRPSRRADSMDLFLDGRAARVQGVYRDLDDATHVAVTLDDDPAADLHGAYGRFFYFHPDEVEPLGSRTEDESNGKTDGSARAADGSDGADA